MTLVEFILQRIAEDEAVAREILDADDAEYSSDWALPASATVDVGDDTFYAGDQRLARHDPARVLAECEAHRRIISWHGEGATETGCPPCWWDDASHCPTLRALAAVHANHPAYDEIWRPRWAG